MALVLVLIMNSSPGASFRIATYNLESYLDTGSPTRSAKSPESKAKVCESILALRPDVLALQELGSSSALLELRDSLNES